MARGHGWLALLSDRGIRRLSRSSSPRTPAGRHATARPIVRASGAPGFPGRSAKAVFPCDSGDIQPVSRSCRAMGVAGMRGSLRRTAVKLWGG
ncbi:hypothetical protein SGL43_06764 [Streptomyces globisporus]|uniref:Uncharacterized protein n=1 Tax=Streptomyces globisporus TaxID=1908 RepID=A0ABN8VDG8_STRGL|nr:hypothetical protein SGL43_06764 [Streptomyces globisporus]